MQFSAIFCVFLLLIQSNFAVGQTPSEGIAISVLSGEGGKNSIKSRTGTPIEIEVRDRQGKAVTGAQVIFQLPSAGASGSFPGGQLQARTRTGPAGQATMTGFVPNAIEGRFNIKITAASGTLEATSIVSQTNVTAYASEQKRHSNKTLWILVAAGAAGGVGAAVALGSGGKASSAPVVPPSVTIVPGTISVGGPH